ncbi:MAG: cyclic peptide export ABC transporter [Acidobacteriota bacterium]
MEFFRFLRSENQGSPRLVVIAILAGIANGIIVSVIVQTARDSAKPGFQPFAVFLVAFVIFVLAKKWVFDRNTDAVENIIHRARARISARMRRSELRHFEEVDKTKLFGVLASDTQMLTESAKTVIGSLSAIILLVFGLVYIAYLSMSAFWTLAGVLGVGVLWFLASERRVSQQFREMREVEDDYFSLLRQAADGFPELRINRQRRDDYYDNYLDATAQDARKRKVNVAYLGNTNRVFASSFLYIILAVIIFILPAFVEQGEDETLQIVSVILFLIGPIGEIVVAVPHLARAENIIKRLRNIESMLVNGAEGSATIEDEQQADEAGAEDTSNGGAGSDGVARGFQSIGCEGLEFSYVDATGRPTFTVGPVDFELERGEVVFLVGGNGTGKTTLLKLLCGLYQPTEGTLMINGEQIYRSDLPRYRANFSIILQDYHLFDRLYGLPDFDMRRVEELRRELLLEPVVDVSPDGRFSTLKLSTGQKKRLALLVSELEDRPILLFDEWAADQDPEHRRYFYNEYLPSLAARGKTVLAATHDDQYFGAADRVLRVSDGKLTPFTGTVFDGKGEQEGVTAS